MLHGCRVLVVGREPSVEFFAEHGLEDCVRIAHSVDEAGEEISGDPPELVLVDLALPEEGALELVRRIRMDPHTAGIPVLVLAATADEGEAVPGASGAVAKPLDFEKLVEAAGGFSLYWRALGAQERRRPPSDREGDQRAESEDGGERERAGLSAPDGPQSDRVDAV